MSNVKLKKKILWLTGKNAVDALQNIFLYKIVVFEVNAKLDIFLPSP